MYRSIFLALAALVLPAAQQPPASEFDLMNAIREHHGLPPHTPAEFAAAKARSARLEVEHEVQRLRGANFLPASEVSRQGRSQIRATFTEPRLFVRMPGVTIERRKDRKIHLTLSSDGRAKTGRSTISNARWKTLVRLEAAAFAPDPPIAPSTWRKGDPIPEAGPSCHGFGVTLERISPAKSEAVWGWECNRSAQSRARLAYGHALATISLTAFPQCHAIEYQTRDPFSALATCFGKFEPSTSDNP